MRIGFLVFTLCLLAAVAGTPAAADSGLLAETPDQEVLLVDVRAECADGRAGFRIRNNGGTWPKAGLFEVYEVRGAKRWQLSQRRLRLKSNQTVSMRPKLRHDGRRVALRIRTAWSGSSETVAACG